MDGEELSALFQEPLAEGASSAGLVSLGATQRVSPEEPYWYSPVIGAGPTEQRRGTGGALLNPALTTFDERGSVAYLESSDPATIPRYVRDGFEILGTIHGATMPPLTPM